MLHLDEVTGKLYSGSADRTIAVWDLHSGAYLESWNCIGDVSSLVHIPSAASNSNQGTGFIASGSSDGTVTLWNTNTGEAVDNGFASPNEVNALTVVNNRFYSASNDRSIYEWDTENIMMGRVFRGHEGYVSSITGIAAMPETSYSTNDDNGTTTSVIIPATGPRLISGSWDGIVKIWDLVTGCCVGTLKAHDRSVNAIALSGDGKYLFTGSTDGKIKIWDLGIISLIHVR